MALFSKNLVRAKCFVVSYHENVVILVSDNPLEALRFASKELTNSYDFIMALLVSQNPLALPSASEELRGNNDIVVSNELQERLLWYRSYPLVTINVVLLSGRCSSILILPIYDFALKKKAFLGHFQP